MSTSLVWYESTGTTPISSVQSISGNSGVPGSGLTLQLINDKGGAASSDPMNSARLKALFDDGSGLRESGTEWADRQYLEARIQTGGLNTDFTLGEWTKLGTGAMMNLPILNSDEGIKVEFRINAPADALADAEDFFPRVVDSPSEATSNGFQESVPGGIYTGINDKGFSEIILGSVITEDSPTSRDVKVPDLIGVVFGKPAMHVAEDITIPVAGSGDERFDLLSLKFDGTVTRTVGTEVTAPVTDADKPALPTGEIPLAWCKATDTGDMLDAAIDNIFDLVYYDFSSTGLTGTLSPGPRAMVSNQLILNTGQQTVALTDDDTNFLWLNRDGVVEATLTEDYPNGRDLLLYEVVTVTGSVTSVIDRRTFMGGGRFYFVEFRFPGEITGADESHINLHNARPAYIIMPHGFAMAAGTNTVGASSGSNVLDVDLNGTTIFGTGSLKPQFAHDASPAQDYFNAIPTVLELPPRAQLRATIDALPTASTTEARGVSLTMLVAM